jgi:NLI interacting factor-like phosphatase
MAFYSETSDFLLPAPRTNQCIVLDLDETLVHASDDMLRFHRLKIATNPQLMDIRDRSYAMTLDDVIERRGTGTKTQLWSITRPYLKEFLVFCFNHFKIVAVWSAGRYKYVHATVEAIFKDIAMPHIIYTWDDCDKSSSGIFKPLEKMIGDETGMSNYMSLSNTYAIDDRPSTYSKNPYNGIKIPEYKPHFTVDGMRIKDNALLQLMNWFKEQHVMASSDVRTLDKTNIFSQSLSANPSNIPDLSSSSLVSRQLSQSPSQTSAAQYLIQNQTSQKSPSRDRPPQTHAPWSHSMFLPDSCVDSNGTVICDPRLKPPDLLDGPNEIRRVINPIGSPMVAFSPSQSPQISQDIQSPSASPIRLKLPMSPSPVYTTDTHQNIYQPPDSPTFTSATYAPTSYTQNMSAYPNSSQYQYQARIPSYYNPHRDITGSKSYIQVPS